MKSWIIKCFLVLMAIIMSTGVAGAYTYFNDFEGESLNWVEWSPHKKATTPTSRNFLGSNPTYGFSNELAILTLPVFQSGSSVKIEIDLFIINSWDGNNINGPEYWSLSTGDGQTLLYTTFLSGYYPPNYLYQSYPDNYPINNTAEAGVTEKDVLGYSYGNGDVYHIIKNYIHTGGPVILYFKCSNLQGVGDESWGLDNIKVEVTSAPIPHSAVLYGFGLTILIGLRRVRRS